MHYLSQILFALITLFSCILFTKRILQIRALILMGKEEDLTNNPSARWRNLLLLAFGQKKMFAKPGVAFLHLVVYLGFIIINVEVLEIVLDGILGTHRLFLPKFGKVYSWLINAFEILALLVLFACVIFLIRRNLLKLKRFLSKDLNGWPRSDANYILLTEIILMSLFLIMNIADNSLQQLGNPNYPFTGKFIVSGNFSLINLGADNLMIIERFCWWAHIIGIFAFLNYLPFSKHLHILLAFPNAFYAKLVPLGQMQNMPAVQKEVLYAMQPELIPAESVAPANFGAKDVFDLSWKNLMDAFTCTECGRCTENCPANITGKLLSPRKIMMDTRDRLEEIGKNIEKNKAWVPDNRSLLNHYISKEELRACTTCNACVVACPVSISPLDIIIELRRSLIMEDSDAPQEWNGTFSNIENNFAPWKFSPDDRDSWSK